MNSKLVQEAPYHPGYEDASFESAENPIMTELNQYRKMNARYMETAKKIVEFLGSGSKAAAQSDCLAHLKPPSGGFLFLSQFATRDQINKHQHNNTMHWSEESKKAYLVYQEEFKVV